MRPSTLGAFLLPAIINAYVSPPDIPGYGALPTLSATPSEQTSTVPQSTAATNSPSPFRPSPLHPSAFPDSPSHPDLPTQPEDSPAPPTPPTSPNPFFLPKLIDPPSLLSFISSFPQQQQQAPQVPLGNKITQRQGGVALGGGVPAPIPNPNQVSPVTTVVVNGVPKVYTQTFAGVPDQFPTAVAGTIGLGTLTGTVGAVRTGGAYYHSAGNARVRVGAGLFGACLIAAVVGCVLG